MIDSTTSARAIGFLIWFRKFYNGETRNTLNQIAEDYGHCNYGTVRHYLLELEENGYIQVSNRAKRAQIINVNEEQYQELVK